MRSRFPRQYASDVSAAMEETAASMHRTPLHDGRIIQISSFLLLCAFLLPSLSFAQRPFLLHDPLYRSEQSQRAFFSGYAITAEVAYRNAGSIQGEALQTLEPNPLGLSFRLDYKLAASMDMSAIVDAAGSTIRRGLSLSWLVFKYYERSETASFALRLAVDPSFDGRAGFPQIDVAWLSSSLLTPLSSTEFAFGIRRVRLGYEQWVISEPVLTNNFVLHDAEVGLNTRNDLDVIRTRALGWEIHMMLGYNVKFDPAGSNLFVSLLGQAGSYDLLETSEQEPLLQQLTLAAAKEFKREVTTTSEYLGGIVWFRAGIEFNRPSYQILPFIGIPLQQWTPSSRDWPRSKRQIGVRLMLR